MHKAISLSAEMAEIRNAVEGARFLADELATRGMEDRKRELQAPLTISAILVLVELRLHQIERVLRGEEDPLLLWAPHNDVSPIQAEDEEHDLVLRSWSVPGKDEEPSPRKWACPDLVALPQFVWILGACGRPHERGSPACRR
jgi:hypothetical protein